MYKTPHGNFNGDSWEEFCQICFKQKYENEGYQEMPAWQGDFGIEGFTRTGTTFQCYCPDDEYNPDKLYEEQRDKITADLNKLEKYESQLKGYFKDVKIKKWLFVTPGYKKKDIVKHCTDKALEFRKKNLSILDPSFDVQIQNIDFFAKEINTVLNYQKKKIVIGTVEDTSEEEIADWKTKEISLVETAIKKNGQRLPEHLKNRDSKINSLTQFTIQSFLDGNIAIKIMQEKFPQDYEKFMRVVSLFEKKVEAICNTYAGNDYNELYKNIEVELRAKLNDSFSYLDQTTIDMLTEQVAAEWILRCPIKFE